MNIFKNTIKGIKDYTKWLFRKPSISYEKDLSIEDFKEIIRGKNLYKLSRGKHLLILFLTIVLGIIVSINYGNILPFLMLSIAYEAGVNIVSKSGTSKIKYISSLQLSSTTFIISYSLPYGSYWASYVQALTIDGDTITAGTAERINYMGNAVAVELSAFSSTEFIIGYQRETTEGDPLSGEDPYVRKGTVSTRTITLGTATKVATITSSIGGVKVECLDSTKFIYCYFDYDYNTFYRSIYKVGTISGSSISFGTETYFDTGGTDIYIRSITKIDSTHFAISYTNYVSSVWHTYLKYCSISGTTITLGDNYDTGFGNTELYLKLIDSTHLLGAYKASGYGTCVVFTISAGSFSKGTSQSFTNYSCGFGAYALNKLDTDKFIIVFNDFSETNYGAKSIIINISGTSISYEEEQTFYNTNQVEPGSLSSIPLSTTKIVNTYSYNTTDSYLNLMVGNYTAPVVAPTVTTQSATNIAATSCTGNGNITATGGENCTRRGFCYKAGTSGDPTTSDSVAYDESSYGTGAFTKSITGLTPNTSYRVRAYAVNSAGTGYGATVQVKTLTAFKPRITWFN